MIHTIEAIARAILIATTLAVAAIMAREGIRNLARIRRLWRSRPSRQLRDANRRAAQVHNGE